MRVEHYDAKTRTIETLMGDQPQPSQPPATDDFKSQLEFWTHEYERLKKLESRTHGKERQEVNLKLAQARAKMHKFRHLAPQINEEKR